MENNICIELWDVITHPCPNFNGNLAKLPMKLGQNEYIYIPHKTVDVFKPN